MNTVRASPEGPDNLIECIGRRRVLLLFGTLPRSVADQLFDVFGCMIVHVRHGASLRTTRLLSNSGRNVPQSRNFGVREPLRQTRRATLELLLGPQSQPSAVLPPRVS